MDSPADPANGVIGVIGGSGFYEFLSDAEEIEVSTPFGPPSGSVVVGTVADRRVAFLPRHGAAIMAGRRW